jgi:redox-sensitive bicupin YhaK (pirin superfamily)
MSTPGVDIRRANQRFHTRTDWLDSWHCFSFADHYDPQNLNHGLLRVLNDDVIAPGRGFGPHPHRDMEIVTWVLEGALAHEDSAGHRGVIRPGDAQRMSAGRGIVHSEVNASATEPVRLVQMWVLPAQQGIAPGYEQKALGDRFEAGGLVVVASGQGHPGAVRLHQPGAVLRVGRLQDGESAALPDAPHVHVYLAKGGAQLAGQTLGPGDAARLTRAGKLDLVSRGASEVLVWETA